MGKYASKAPKWKDVFVLDAYERARAGDNDKDIALYLGVTPHTFCRWMKERPVFAEAVRRGRVDPRTGGHRRLCDHVYGLLPARLQAVWDQIHAFEKAPSAYERIKRVTAPLNTEMRQYLFLHAMIHHNFSRSAACRSLGLGYRTPDYWMEDPDFAELLDTIRQVQADFYESALVERVAEGDTAAIIFANRTFNRGRGYGESVEHKHGGKLSHAHAHAHLHGQAAPALDVADLDLPADVLGVVYDAVQRRQQQTKALPAPAGVESVR